jgi:hypothetical protein
MLIPPLAGATAAAVYLHIADKYHRLTRPTVIGAKRYSLEGFPVIPAALLYL